jgi:hypothetical protein
MVTSPRNLETALGWAATIIVFVTVTVVCGDPARGWIGDRLLTNRSPDQPPFYVLLAAVAMMVFAFSALFVMDALDPRAILDRRGRVESFVYGGLGVAVVLIWIIAGFCRLRRRGGEFQTLKAVKLVGKTARSFSRA